MTLLFVGIERLKGKHKKTKKRRSTKKNEEDLFFEDLFGTAMPSILSCTEIFSPEAASEAKHILSEAHPKIEPSFANFFVNLKIETE